MSESNFYMFVSIPQERFWFEMQRETEHSPISDRGEADDSDTNEQSEDRRNRLPENAHKTLFT